MSQPLLTIEKTPSRRKHHPIVFDPLPGVDYSELAVTHWLDTQLFALDVEKYRTLHEQATRWLDSHDVDHPDFGKARGKAISINSRLRSARKACWYHAACVYACLQHIDAARWLEEYVWDGVTITHPRDVWHLVLPDEEPGQWPIPDETYAMRGEPWNREHLEQSLARKRGRR